MAVQLCPYWEDDGNPTTYPKYNSVFELDNQTNAVKPYCIRYYGETVKGTGINYHALPIVIVNNYEVGGTFTTRTGTFPNFRYLYDNPVYTTLSPSSPFVYNNEIVPLNDSLQSKEFLCPWKQNNNGFYIRNPFEIDSNKSMVYQVEVPVLTNIEVEPYYQNNVMNGYVITSVEYTNNAIFNITYSFNDGVFSPLTTPWYRSGLRTSIAFTASETNKYIQSVLISQGTPHKIWLNFYNALIY